MFLAKRCGNLRAARVNLGYTRPPLYPFVVASQGPLPGRAPRVGPVVRVAGSRAENGAQRAGGGGGEPGGGGCAPRRRLHERHSANRFERSWVPPCDQGMMWLSSSGLCSVPGRPQVPQWVAVASTCFRARACGRPRGGSLWASHRLAGLGRPHTMQTRRGVRRRIGGVLLIGLARVRRRRLRA
jgi:hypothetical protein